MQVHGQQNFTGCSTPALSHSSWLFFYMLNKWHFYQNEYFDSCRCFAFDPRSFLNLKLKRVVLNKKKTKHKNYKLCTFWFRIGKNITKTCNKCYLLKTKWSQMKGTSADMDHLVKCCCLWTVCFCCTTMQRSTVQTFSQHVLLFQWWGEHVKIHSVWKQILYSRKLLMICLSKKCSLHTSGFKKLNCGISSDATFCCDCCHVTQNQQCIRWVRVIFIKHNAN